MPNEPSAPDDPRPVAPQGPQPISETAVDPALPPEAQQMVRGFSLTVIGATMFLKALAPFVGLAVAVWHWFSPQSPTR